MSVPKAMQATYDEIAAIIREFSDAHLSDEYLALCLKALAKLCRKRPSPLLGGRANTWAAGIVYAIGQANFIFDSSQPIHMSAEELSAPFGLAKSTVGNKGKEVRSLLSINRLSHEWRLPSKLKDDPFAWYITVNGLMVDARTLPRELQEIALKKKLIPYIPEDRDE